MATISITNQTLTISLIVDGATTVIRKDNCKVQAFGDVVRITDYTGTIYEFLYTDCESPSEASGEDLRDAIEAFLNTAGGGDLGYTEYVALVTQNGTNPPTVTTQSNNTGLTFTSEYNEVGDYVLSFSSYPSAGKVNVQFCNGDSGYNVSAFYTAGTGVKISCFDIASQVLSDSGIGNASLIIRILP